MDRRDFLKFSAATTIFPRDTPRVSWERYESAIIIDALGGVGDRRGATGSELSAAALEHIAASGVTAVNATIGTIGAGENLFRTTLQDLDRWDRRLEQHSDRLAPIRSASDIRQAKTDGRTGVIYGFQDAAMLEGDHERLATFFRRGVRIIQLTYNRRNELGDGSLEEENRGITPFGREVIEQMNELGMMVDLSHCGDLTTAEGIAHSNGPVAITHSGSRVLADLPRNKWDAEMRSLADKGGVFGVYFMPFLSTRGQPNADDVVRHIEHVLNVCGEDHVGIGTDGSISPVPLTEAYRNSIREEIRRRRAMGISAPGETDDIVPLIPDLNHERRLEDIADRLISRNHSSNRVEKILGGNFLRLMTEVWRE